MSARRSCLTIPRRRSTPLPRGSASSGPSSSAEPPNGHPSAVSAASPPSSAVSTQVPAVGQREGVLEVRGPGAVGGDDGPVVVEQSVSWPPRVTIGSTASAMPCDQPRRRGPAGRSWARRAAGASPSRCRGRRSPRRCRSAPCARSGASTACEMSPTRPPSRAAAMPRHMAASVTRDQLGRPRPAPRRPATVIAASPCQPSTIAPQSIETRSPSRSRGRRGCRARPRR